MTAASVGASDPSFRKTLLECFLNIATSEGLSAWLTEIGQDPRGSVENKRQRIREHTQYLSMPRETFPQQTQAYLWDYTAEHLDWICSQLGISSEGTKDDLYRRIYREVGYREGWLTPPSAGIETFDKGLVLPFVAWYPIRRRSDYESGYYETFLNEMLEVFGDEYVHPQYPVAHGSTLKIDFHIGHSQRAGVGVEFKRPMSNSELQRALGQMDQYLGAYGENLIVVLFPDTINKAQEALFVDVLRGKGIATVVKDAQPL